MSDVTRSRLHAVAVFAAALGVIVLAGPASDWNRLRFDPESPHGIVSLELASTPSEAESIVARWDKEARVEGAVTAVHWDFAFLVSYGIGLALLCLWTSRKLGRVVAALALVAALCDAAENLGLLTELKGAPVSESVAFATSVFARAKFVLLIVVGTYLALAVVLRPRKRGPAPESWSAPTVSQAVAPELRFCDVVMKGGITSGVVYPKAVYALSRAFRFRSIGGASAGAVAAAVTAAAEYARQKNGMDNFNSVSAVPDWLAKNDGQNLTDLFRPDPLTRPIFEIIAPFLENAPLASRIGGALGAAARHFGSIALIAALPAAALFVAILGAPRGPEGASILVLLIWLAIAIPVALAIAFLLRAWRVLGSNGFGICSGTAPGDPEAPTLSLWLADVIDKIANGIAIDRPESIVTGRPLTMGDLWCADLSDATGLLEEEARRRWLDPIARSVNLEVMTTSLTQSRPYRIPFDQDVLYFDPADLVRVLPERVVRWMVEHPGTRPAELLARIPAGTVPLPDPWNFPVVLAARMSLSFPILLSAVRLKTVDFTRPENQGSSGILTVEDVWFSDGGISSNFPIHFFDRPLPRWPTFGLDLAPFHRDFPRDPDETKNVFLPRTNRGRISERITVISGLGEFARSLLESLQAWMDGLNSHAPGFRDRIVRVYLDPDEGGLNLRMPSARISRLAARGYCAGLELVEAFTAGGDGWENHVNVRFRTAFAAIERWIAELVVPFRTSDYREILEHPERSPAYELTPEQALLAREMARRIEELAALTESAGTNMRDGAPRPEPELQIRPRI